MIDSDSFGFVYDRICYNKKKIFHWKPTVIEGKTYFLEHSYHVSRTEYEDFTEYGENTVTMGHRPIIKTFTVMKRLYGLYEPNRLWEMYNKSGFLFKHRK